MLHTAEFRTSLEQRRNAAIDFSKIRVPGICFSPADIPTQDNAERLGRYIRRQFVQDAGRLAIVEAIVDFKDWDLRYVDLSTGQGAMAPAGRGYMILVANSPEISEDQAAEIVGHEIGHTFFYYRGRDGVSTRHPRRKYVDEEERFCNQFSALLTEDTSH